MVPPNGRVFTSSILPPGGLLHPSATPLFLYNGVGVIRLSKPVIIVIGVFGLVCSFIIFVLLFKYFLHPTSSPLPQKQPLAHHREREFKYLPRPYFPRNSTRLDQADRYGSDTSPLRPSRMSSFRTVDSSVTASSGYHSSLTPTLPQNYWSGQLSVEPNSDDHVSTIQHYVSTARLAHSASLSRSKQQLSRKSPTASTRSVSPRSVNTIRGAPHSPYSNIQIVLPTPLAPQLWGHMIADPLAIQSRGGLLEQGGITDRWMAAPIRTTSWHSRPNQDPSVVDASPEREASLSSGQSSDNVDQLSQPESQTRPRGRTSSRHPIQRLSLGLEDPTPSPQSPDDQTQPFRVKFQDPRDGQGTLMSTRSKSILIGLP